MRRPFRTFFSFYSFVATNDPFLSGLLSIPSIIRFVRSISSRTEEIELDCYAIAVCQMLGSPASLLRWIASRFTLREMKCATARSIATLLLALAIEVSTERRDISNYFRLINDVRKYYRASCVIFVLSRSNYGKYRRQFLPSVFASRFQSPDGS